MKTLAIVMLALACGGCNLFEGTKDESRPDVLNSGSGNGDTTVVYVGGQNNNVDVRGRTTEQAAE